MSKATDQTNPQHLLPALRSHLWFASCSLPLQMALVERSRVVSLKPGERLFSRGESDEALCCVLSGALKLGTFNTETDTQVLSMYVEPYQWFGEIALIDHLPRSQDAVADANSTVLVASRSVLEPWLNEHPHYWRELARLVCLKMRMLVVLVEDNASLPLDQQLVRRLLMSSTNFGMNYPMSFKRHLRLPQEYLARMMGVSRQTINRALKTLAEQGIIMVRYADIELLDVPGLMARAGPMNQSLVSSLRGMAEAAERNESEIAALSRVNAL
jgi:CRP/FNR family transcriptional regulator, cyclic AMP receptor protein